LAVTEKQLGLDRRRAASEVWVPANPNAVHLSRALRGTGRFLG
jgi:hypothetical protein